MKVVLLQISLPGSSSSHETGVRRASEHRAASATHTDFLLPHSASELNLQTRPKTNTTKCYISAAGRMQPDTIYFPLVERKKPRRTCTRQEAQLIRPKQ